MIYRVTMHYRGTEEVLTFDCDALNYGINSVCQTVVDALQITKDHWNITKITIDWDSPKEYTERV